MADVVLLEITGQGVRFTGLGRWHVEAIEQFVQFIQADSLVKGQALQFEFVEDLDTLCSAAGFLVP